MNKRKRTEEKLELASEANKKMEEENKKIEKERKKK
jgi:hypothetical protein